ncbi:MAG: hypothetical protein ACJA0H_000496 [Francisellaceae bacterium]|jgi:hypothetical protein
MCCDLITAPKNARVFSGSKNKNSIFTSTNSDYLSLVGSKTSIIGLSDYEIKSSTSDSAKDFYDQDRLVEKTRAPLKILDVHFFAQGLAASIFIKKPKYSGSVLIGTNFFGWYVDNMDLISLSISLSNKLSKEMKMKVGQNSLIIKDSFLDLTEKQFISLCLSSLNLNSKQIGNYFGTRERAIDEIFIRIKNKIGFTGKSRKKLCELMVYEHGLHHYIPARLILQSKDVSNFI